ncbi:L-alanine-DL-glutamate epimerase-like enolase superfamily enzyme [Serratia fonticola]|uniref:Dipeptide epimerase n=1 Tax=Serratia fonticola TaxID=47917 RepID=A0A542D2R2_SERFO|nr:L-Ala-D/L-Glu epimerase [Serratia fonticola]TQI80651.1 L-alanine-DL-glutamate epimerase-like enolase superfamily enzyme [Serratia fonticola]TQI97324.1 L-alanine-DL-glutamate epimerase-like enolase superfamily enzyme [Serratia fonticola]TVZ71820.1 L-alanine-DL-glutamate epimerase-like enolase superfamily enzyme [Serratia fonticola]
MRSMRFYPEAWPLHTAFVIARGSRTEAKVVVVEIEQEGKRGVGECTPYPRYGESEASVMQQLAEVAGAIAQGATRQDLLQLMPAGAARNAVDSALWALECSLTGRDRWQLSKVEAPQRIVMAQTVSIGTPEAMAFAAKELEQQGVTLLKIKLDNHLISERLIAIRTAVPEITLIVDANESWQAEGLASRCQLLADLGVAMLEQPLPANDDRALENFIHPLPICADESCHTSDDLPQLVGRYDMVNIKLDKTGGLTEGLNLARQARAQGFEIMLGCMLCTSRAIEAALPLVPGARFVDLDGPTWLAKDVEPGLAFECGVINL